MSHHQNGYAHPEALVSTEWLAEHLDDPNLRVVESNEDPLLYDQGHIPGAVKIDWHQDLNDPLIRLAENWGTVIIGWFLGMLVYLVKKLGKYPGEIV